MARLLEKQSLATPVLGASFPEMRLKVMMPPILYWALASPIFAQATPAPEPPIPDLRAPTEAEMKQLDSGWSLIEWHQSSAFPGNTIKAIDRIKPLVNDTFGPDHPVAHMLEGLRGQSLLLEGKHDEAEAVLAATVPALERRLGPGAALTLATRSDRANNLIELGRLGDAAQLFEENARLVALEPERDPVARTRFGLDIAYLRRLQGRFAEAEALARPACHAESTAATKLAAIDMRACTSLARALTGLGRIHEATTLLRTILADYTPKDVPRAMALLALAEADAEAGRQQDAFTHAKEAATLAMETAGYFAPITMEAAARKRIALFDLFGRSVALSVIAYDDGSPINAQPSDCSGVIRDWSTANFVFEKAVQDFDSLKQRACLERLRDFFERGFGPDAPATLDVRERLVAAIARTGDTEPALEEARALLVAREQVSGPAHPASARAMLLYAQALTDMGRAQEADALVQRAASVLPTEAFSFNANRLDTMGAHREAAEQWLQASKSWDEGPKQSLQLAFDIFAGRVFNALYQGRCADDVRRDIADVVGAEVYQIMGQIKVPVEEARAILLACEGKWAEAAKQYQSAMSQAGNRSLVFQDANAARMEARRALTFYKNPDYYDLAWRAATTASFYASERRYTPDRDAADKPLGYRRTMATAGLDPLAIAFSTVVTVSWGGGSKPKKFGNGYLPARDMDGAFRAAQDYAQSQAAASLLEAAARSAVTDPSLRALLDEQTALAERISATDRRLATDGAQAVSTELSPDTDRQRLAALVGELRQRFPAYANTARPFGLSIEETRKRLRPGEALLLIQPVGDAIYSFAISATAAEWNKAEIDRDEMDRLVASLRCRIDPRSCTVLLPGEFLFEGSAAAALYRQLIVPVLPGLGDAKTLYTVTGGSLGSIPLGILVTGDPPPQELEEAAELASLAKTEWLADAYALATLPSVSSLRAYEIAVGARPAAQGFTGIGDPLLGPSEEVVRGGSGPRTANVRGANNLADGTALRELSSLPGTRRELLAIARALGSEDSELLLAEAATEARLKAAPQMRDARIIVFATHAMLPGELAGNAEPGLVFTPPDHPSELDDGYLTATEAAALQLNADWVVLSACNTAGPAHGGSNESLSGLARAFFYAGARSLLVSHWPVLDTVGAAITSEAFRIGAARPELSRPEALQLALRGIRSGTSVLGDPVEGWQPNWADPWAWAPFSLIETGDS